MGKLTTLTTGRASLWALGAYVRRRCCFIPLMAQVTMAQKVGKYRPGEKLLDGLLGMRCGAKTLAQSHVTLTGDRAVQRAFGRQGCAEPSTLARTLHACTAETVAQRERVSWDYWKRDGATPRPPFQARLLWVDADGTPLPRGAKAEGRERAWMGRHRSKTGRKPRRLSASAYREILHDTLLRGKAAAVPALKAALVDLEARMGWTRELRQRLVSRLAGGVGTTAGRNWWRSRGDQVVAKSSHRGRGHRLRREVGPWEPTSSEGRERAAVLAPLRFCRSPRQWVIRTPKEQGG